MIVGDRVKTERGATGVVHDVQNGRAFVKIDRSGNTGWFPLDSLTAEAAKTWPPQVETKIDA